jgi:hypothetical protein
MLYPSPRYAGFSLEITTSEAFAGTATLDAIAWVLTPSLRRRVTDVEVAVTFDATMLDTLRDLFVPQVARVTNEVPTVDAMVRSVMLVGETMFGDAMLVYPKR